MSADVAEGGGGISPSLMAARKYLGYAALGALTATAGKLAFSAAKAAAYYVQKYGMWMVRSAWNHIKGGGLAGAAYRWITRKKSACGCFVASTIVWTASGMVPIEHVRVGDLVVARDESTGQIELRPVDALIVTEGAALLDVTVVHPGGRVETIRTTDEHPFWVECPAPGPGEIQRPAEPMTVRDPNAPAAWRSSEFSGWRRADGLRAGDELRTISGPATVVGLAFTAERQRVHNLTVRGLATYHVGPDGVVVHNCNYRSIFIGQLRASGRALPSGYHVHHRIPQQYRDSGLFPADRVDSVGNLAGVDPGTHGQINRLWNTFRARNSNPTAEHVETFAAQVDAQFMSRYILP